MHTGEWDPSANPENLCNVSVTVPPSFTKGTVLHERVDLYSHHNKKKVEERSEAPCVIGKENKDRIIFYILDGKPFQLNKLVVNYQTIPS